MKNHKIIYLILIGLFLQVNIYAQEPFRPGILYEPGNELYEPKSGVTSAVPEGWRGVLPQGDEVFLLTSETDPLGSIYVFVLNESMERIREKWEDEAEFQVQNVKKVKTTDVKKKNNKLVTELDLENTTRPLKGYAETKCSEFGWCAVFVLISPTKYFKEQKKQLTEFVNNSELVEPQIGNR